jgi:hypothetical protein
MTVIIAEINSGHIVNNQSIHLQKQLAIKQQELEK